MALDQLERMASAASPSVHAEVGHVRVRGGVGGPSLGLALGEELLDRLVDRPRLLRLLAEDADWACQY